MLNVTEFADANPPADGSLDGSVLLGPADPTPPTPLRRAQTLCELGRFSDAVPAVGSVIAQEPRDGEAWCLMARAQLGNERPAAALEAARAATGLLDGRAEPLRLASLALGQLGRDEEAAEAALQATRSEPSAWEAHARLAHCLAAFRNRLGEAREAAGRALALRPDEAGPHLAVGAVALAAGRRTDAAAAFCAALAADPQCVEAHNQLAVVQSMPRRRMFSFGRGSGSGAKSESRRSRRRSKRAPDDTSD